MKRILAAGLVLAAISSTTALASADAAPSNHTHATARAAAYAVTATVNRSEPLQGSRVTIKGSVAPAAPGARVTLQVRYQDQKKWKTVDSTTLSRASKYRFRDKVTTVRERRYRVVKPAGPHRAAGHSPRVEVTVFGWRDLTTISPTAGFFTFVPTVTAFNGVSYPSSLRSSYYGAQSPDVSIEFNLDRGCKALRTTVGLDDSSPSGSATTVSLTTDGVQRYTGSFGLTQSAPVAFDITKVFRLTIRAANTGGGFGALGTPQVLCSF
jgi:hypothetical protein